MNQLGRFITATEKDYFEKRSRFVDGADKMDIANNPFLFATRQSITDYLVRIELFNRIKAVSGHIVECGVNRGNSFMLFSHLSAIHEPYAINRKIVGFDSFGGFRSISSEHDPAGISEDDFNAARTFETLQESIGLYDLNRPIAHMARCDVIKGDAVDTIPRYVKDHPEMTIALLYLDFDLYKPTLVGLQHLLPLVCKGGLVVLDEFNYDKFPGETAALKEMLDINSIRLERFPFAPFVAYFER
jgi:hypothetical protein